MPHNVTTVTPNHYQLSGHHIHVTYSTTSLTGEPILSYMDAHQAKSFRGDEIRAIACDLGTLVSVTLHMTVDVGSTTFSLFIPRMEIAQGTSATVRTYGVTTMHSMPFAPPAARGQLDTYTVKDLHGTAEFVIP